MIKLLKGDCLVRMKEIPDKSVDAIITDIPYGTTNCVWDSVIPFAPMWEQLKRIIKPNGAIVLFGSQPFTSALIMSNVKMFKYEWVWEKTQATGYLDSKRKPMKAHENILVFCEKQSSYYPQKTFGHKRKTTLARHKQNTATNQAEIYGKADTFTDYDTTERYPRTVVLFKSDKQTEAYHPTQKPVALIEYLIKTYTNEGEIVLDFTMGSGTTGIACLNTNRSFIGIEKDEKYFSIAKDRITKHYNELKKVSL